MLMLIYEYEICPDKAVHSSQLPFKHTNIIVWSNYKRQTDERRKSKLRHYVTNLTNLCISYEGIGISLGLDMRIILLSCNLQKVVPSLVQTLCLQHFLMDSLSRARLFGEVFAHCNTGTYVAPGAHDLLKYCSRSLILLLASVNCTSF